jgi:hypothetical protein
LEERRPPSGFWLLAEKLAERGHGVFYLTSSRDRGFTEFVTSVVSGVTVIRYPHFGSRFVHRIHKLFRGKKARNRGFEGAMRSVIAENRIDLVYLHYASKRSASCSKREPNSISRS